MKLYSAKIPSVATALVSALTNEGDIEVGNREEVELDVSAVRGLYVVTGPSRMVHAIRSSRAAA